MFESVVAGILVKYLGQYVSNLDPDKLNISVLGGDVVLHDLKLTKDALESRGIPLTIETGYIKTLCLKAPWKKLKTEPVIVIFDGVYGVIRPSKPKPYDPVEEEKKRVKAKMSKVESADLVRRSRDKVEDVADEKEEGYVGKMVEAAMDNVQIDVRNIHLRYEDNETVPGAPFAAGITLDRLTLHSTDENWKTSFRVGQRLVFKLGELKCFSLYWDTDYKPVTVVYDGSPTAAADKEQFLKQMDDAIPRSGDDEKHHYILQPVSAGLKAIINKKPDAKKDPNLPKTDVMLQLEAIDLRLENKHVSTLQEIGDVFGVHQKRLKYQHIRPNVPIRGNARTWWLFASEPARSVVRDRQNRARWEWIKQRRDMRRKYIEIYRKKMELSEKKFKKEGFEDKINLLENNLSAEDIIFFRTLAEIMAAKEKQAELDKKRKKDEEKKSTSWFGGKKKTPVADDDDKESKKESAIDEQTKKDLFDLIDYDPSQPPGKQIFPPEFVVTRVKFSLGRCSLMFAEVGTKVTHILHTSLERVDLNAMLRSTSQYVRLTLGSLAARDLCSKAKDLRPLILDASGKNNVPFVDITFEGHPLDRRATHAVAVKILPLHVMYNNDIIARLIAFGARNKKKTAPPIEVDTTEMNSRLQNVQTKTWSQLADALEAHTTVDLDVDIQAPVIIIPKDPARKDSDVLVADLGRLTMKSDLRRDISLEDAQRKMKNSNTKNVDVNSFYDKYVINLQQVQLFLSRADVDWKAKDAAVTHIVHGFDIGINLFNSIVPNDVTVTKAKATATLPDLSLAFSLMKYKQILSIMSSIDPMARARLIQPPPDPVEEELMAGEGSVQSGEKIDLNLAKLPSEPDKTSVSLAKRVLMDCQFTLQKLMFVILSDEDTVVVPDFSQGKIQAPESCLRALIPANSKEPGVPLLVFALFNVDLHLLSRTFDKDITFFLHAMFIEDCIQRASNQYKFLVMSHNPREVDKLLPDIPMVDTRAPVSQSQHLIEIAVRLIGAKSPFYEKIDKAISLTSHALHVNFNRETVAYLMSVGQSFAASQPPKVDPAVERAAQMTVAAQGRSRSGSKTTSRTRGSISSQRSIKSTSSVKSAGGHSKKLVDDSVTKLKLTLNVAGLSLSMNEVIQGSTLMTLLMSNVHTDVEMRARVMMASGYIGLLDIIDETKASKLGYKYVVKSVTDKPNDKMCAFEFYSQTAGLDVPPNSKPPLPSSDYDTHVVLSTCGMHIVFLNRFAQEAKIFFAGLNTLKKSFASATAAVAEKSIAKAKTVDVKKRVLLDVKIRSPIIIVPRNTLSNECLIIDLGQLLLYNNLTIIPNTKNSVKDDMSCIVEGVGVRSGVYKEQKLYSDRKYGTVLLADSAFRVSVVRSLDPSYHGIPQVDVISSLSDIPVTFHKSQMHLLLQVLHENLKEMPTPGPPIPKFSTKKIVLEPIPRRKTISDKKVTFMDIPSRPGTMVAIMEEEEEQQQAIIPAQPSDELFKNIVVSFRMNGVSISLINDVKIQGKSEPIMTFHFNKTEARLTMNSDTSLDVKMLITNLTLIDIRSGAKSFYPHILTCSDGDESTAQLVKLSLSKKAAGDVNLVGSIKAPRLTIVPDILSSLTEFGNMPAEVTKTTPPDIPKLTTGETVEVVVIPGLDDVPEEGGDVGAVDQDEEQPAHVVKQVTAVSITDDVVRDECRKKPPPQIHVTFTADAPVIYCILDPFSKDTPAICIKMGDNTIKYDRAPYVTDATKLLDSVKGYADMKMKHLELYTCVMNDVAHTMIPVLSPFTCKVAAVSDYEVQYEINETDELAVKPVLIGTGHTADVKFDPLDIKASYGDFVLLMNIVKRISAKAPPMPVAPGTKQPAKPVVKKLPPKPKSKGPEPKIHLHLLGLAAKDGELMKRAGDDFSLLVIDDSGGKCTPLFQYTINRITGELSGTPSNMIGKFNNHISASAYNNRLSAWEPLIEDWTCDWNLRRCPSDQMDAEDQHLEPSAVYTGGLKTRMKLESKDRLEINVSQSLLLQFKENAESLKADFEALQKGTGLQDIRESFSPFMIRNATGMPIKYSAGKDSDQFISVPVDGTVPIEFRHVQRLSREQLTGPGGVDAVHNAARMSTTHVVSVSIQGFDTLANIPVFRVACNEFILAPRIGGMSVRALVDVVLERGSKIAVIRSVLSVKNGTKYPIDLKWVQVWTPDQIERAISEKEKKKVVKKKAIKLDEDEPKTPIDMLNEDAMPDAPDDLSVGSNNKVVYESPIIKLKMLETIYVPLTIAYFGGFHIRPEAPGYEWSSYIQQERRLVTKTKSGLPVLYISKCDVSLQQNVNSIMPPPYRFSICYDKQENNIISVDPQTVISIEPPMVLENVTLLPFEYEIRNEIESYSGLVGRSEAVDLTMVQMTKPWKLRMRFPSLTYEWSADVDIHTAVPNVAPARKVYLKSSSEYSLIKDQKLSRLDADDKPCPRELVLDLDYIMYPSGSVCVSVYSPFLVSNETGMPLFYRPSIPKLAGIHCHDGNELSLSPPKKGEEFCSLPNLEMFSWCDFDSILGKNKMSFSTTDGRWTTPICIDTAGYSGAISIETSNKSASETFTKYMHPDIYLAKDNVGSAGQYDLGVSISVGSRHFRRSRIVTLTPLYVIVNSCEDINICLRQPPPNMLCKSETKELLDGSKILSPTYLRDGVASPVLVVDKQSQWHWPVRFLPKCVQVTALPKSSAASLTPGGDVSGQLYEWSGRVSISDIGDETIVLHKGSEQFYLSLNVVQRDNMTYILFSKAKSAPYVVYNHVPFPVKLVQCYNDSVRRNSYSLMKTLGRDTKHECLVSSFTHCQFGWDEPTKTHSVKVYVGDAEFKKIYSLDKLTRYKKFERTRANKKATDHSKNEDHVPNKLIKRLVIDVIAEGPCRMVHVYEEGSAVAETIRGMDTRKVSKKSSGLRSVDDVMSDQARAASLRANSSAASSDRASSTDKSDGADRTSQDDEEGVNGATEDVIAALKESTGTPLTSLPSTAFEVSLVGVGVSIVDGMPREVVYACANSISLNLTVNMLTTGIELNVHEIQVLNQLPFANNCFIVSPNKVGRNAKDVLQLSVVKNNSHKEVAYFDYIGFLMQELDVYVDDPLITAIMGFAQPLMPHDQRLLAAGGGSCANLVVGDTRRRLKDEFKVFKLLGDVKEPPKVSDAGRVYMEILQLNPIKINVSFQSGAVSDDAAPTKSTGTAGESPISMYLRTLGVTVAAIDAAPICLNALLLEDPFISPQALQSKLKKHYIRQGVSQLYKIIGSFDLFGNPVGLLGNVGTGVKDFFMEPAQGLVKSPKEFGLGLARGTASLLKHTVYGLFNTASKITSTVGKGVATLTMDPAYIKNREQTHAREKPKHLGEGLMYGSKDLAKGVGLGLAGIYTQPMQGAAQHGVRGFFTGLGKGIVGVAVKPAVGVLDFASQTTLGMRNSTTLMDDVKLPTRYPRFIPVSRVIVSYDGEDARAQYELTHIRGSAFKKDLMLFNKMLGSEIVVVSNLRLLLISYPDYKFIWAVPWKYVDTYVQNRTGIIVIISSTAKKIVDKNVPNQVLVPCVDTVLLSSVHHKIAMAHSFYKNSISR